MKKLKDLSLLKTFLINEGSVFLMHQSILKFGKPDDWHYSLCYSAVNEFKKFAKFNPGTSQKHSNKIKVFKIRFEKDTDIKSTGKDTYILLSQIRNISVSNCINNEVSRYMGNLHQDVLQNYRKAVKEYIRSHYINRNSF